MLFERLCVIFLLHFFVTIIMPAIEVIKIAYEIILIYNMLYLNTGKVLSNIYRENIIH